MSCPIFTVLQSKIVKVETTQQAENLSKPLPYPTILNYQAKPKCLAHFSPSHKAKLSKWRLSTSKISFQTTSLSHDNKLSSQTKTLFFRWPARMCQDAANIGLAYFFGREPAPNESQRCVYKLWAGLEHFSISRHPMPAQDTKTSTHYKTSPIAYTLCWLSFLFFLFRLRPSPFLKCQRRVRSTSRKSFQITSLSHDDELSG